MKATITMDDGSIYEGSVTLKTPAPTPVPPPNPTPVPTPTPVAKKYIMLNCINWGAGMTTPLQPASEYTYFVLLVNADGSLKNGNVTQEAKFVSDVHAKGGKATFSIAGGTQAVADITSAVRNKTGLINAIKARLATGYDGVTLDIENTALTSAEVNSFITDLRVAIGTAPIIGIYTQPFQKDTVWKDINLVKDAITWLSPMIYDYANTVTTLKNDVSVWEVKVGKEKLLVGAALNYNATGLDLTELPVVMDWIKTEGLMGMGIWENTKYIKSYQDIVEAKR